MAERRPRLIRVLDAGPSPPEGVDPLRYCLFTMFMLDMRSASLRWLRAEDGAESLFMVEEPTTLEEAAGRAGAGDYVDFRPVGLTLACFKGFSMSWDLWEARLMEARRLMEELRRALRGWA